MRIFRCISKGEINVKGWSENFTLGKTYLQETSLKDPSFLIGDDNIGWYVDLECFKEVFTEETANIEINLAGSKQLHKDTDLGHFAGLAMQGILSTNQWCLDDDEKNVAICINLAEELIKQLNEKKAT